MTMLALQRTDFWGEDTSPMAQFVVTIFNQQVRDKVQDGEHHRQFTDDWADFHYIDIDAETEDQARSRINGRYPASQGLVIDSILKQEASKFE